MAFLELDIAVLITTMIIVGLQVGLGIYILKYREKHCTETIIAKIEKITPQNCILFTCYSLDCTFIYNNKEYKIRKGLFKTPPENLKEIEVHIDPKDPNECYLFKICERCKSFPNK